MGVTWFVWNPQDIIFFALLSYAIYGIIKYTNDPSFERFKKGLSAAWFASGMTIFGFFFVGLYCLISLALYVGLVYSTEYFVWKYKKKVRR